MTNQEKFKLFDSIEKYRNNPVAFVEDFSGVKLNTYQKIFLSVLNTKDQFIGMIGSKMNSKKWLQNMQLEYMKAMKMNFEVWRKGEIEVYENGELIRTISNK